MPVRALNEPIAEDALTDLGDIDDEETS